MFQHIVRNDKNLIVTSFLLLYSAPLLGQNWNRVVLPNYKMSLITQDRILFVKLINHD